MRKFPLALILAVSLSLGAQTSPSTEMLITHVTVVDVVSGIENKDQTVALRGNRIVAIEASEETSNRTSAEVIDAHGGFLIPGLWDMHVHVHDTEELPLYVANGVTGVRIMSGSRDMQAMRAELARQSISPQLVMASAIVDGPAPFWPHSIVVKKAADARKTVDEIKAGGADFIKVYDGIPRDAYFALADEAKKQNISFAGHVPEAITAQEASAAGQRTMEHLQGIALGCSSNQQILMGKLSQMTYFYQKMPIVAEGYRTIDPSKCQVLFKEFQQNETWQVPTLTVNRMWGRLNDGRFLSDKRVVYLSKNSISHWTDRTYMPQRRWPEQEFDLLRNIFSADKQTVGLMFRAGVPLLAGTDAMNPYCFPGFSLHDELGLLAESGLTPLAALQTATINPARFLGRTQDLGTVAAGKLADLVLLDADPLADIHNTTHIQAVWLEGRYLDRTALDQLLNKAKQYASRH